MMDQPATRAVEQFVHADYPLDAAAVLLVEADGTPEEVAAEMEEIRAVLTASGATEIRVSSVTPVQGGMSQPTLAVVLTRFVSSGIAQSNWPKVGGLSLASP